MKYVVLLLVASSACTRFQPGRAIFIGSASTSHMMCSAVFVSGREPDVAYTEEMRPESGMGLIDWALSYVVNRDDKSVRTRVAGGFASRAAYHEGLGCRLDNDDNRALPTAPTPVELPEDTSVVETNDPRIREAIDAAFAEPNPLAYRTIILAIAPWSARSSRPSFERRPRLRISEGASTSVCSPKKPMGPTRIESRSPYRHAKAAARRLMSTIAVAASPL